MTWSAGGGWSVNHNGQHNFDEDDVCRFCGKAVKDAAGFCDRSQAGELTTWSLATRSEPAWTGTGQPGNDAVLDPAWLADRVMISEPTRSDEVA